MKKLFTVLCIASLFSQTCIGQQYMKDSMNYYNFNSKDTVYRFYVEVDTFLIKYANSTSYTLPSVGYLVCDSFGNNCKSDTARYRATRHFFSKIYVYQLIGNSYKRIGKQIDGIYVEYGCWEDDPKNWVDIAKRNR